MEYYLPSTTTKYVWLVDVGTYTHPKGYEHLKSTTVLGIFSTWKGAYLELLDYLVEYAIWEDSGNEDREFFKGYKEKIKDSDFEKMIKIFEKLSNMMKADFGEHYYDASVKKYKIQ